MKVVITGGSGLIGRTLSHLLVKQGHEVRWLSRQPSAQGPFAQFHWDPEQGLLDPASLEGIDTLVHLAGTPIAEQRWTPRRKAQILASRVQSMALLTKALQQQQLPLNTLVGASAVGIYGANTRLQPYREEEEVHGDFLSDTCHAWEAAYRPLSQSGCRTVILRVGVVLDPEGGALKRLLPLFQKGLGSPIGSGRQYLPWIHSQDIASVFLKAITDPSMQGVYNAAAPQAVTNREFTHLLAKQLHCQLWMPAVPGFLMKALYGEMALALLEGSPADVSKLETSGYQFQYPDLAGALRDLLG